MRRSFEIGQTIAGITVIRAALRGTYEVKCTSGHTFIARTYAIARLVTGETQQMDCPQCQDLTGKQFGRLKVLCPMPKRDRHGKIAWHCICDCGHATFVSGTKLRAGLVGSCGRVGCRIGTSHGLSKKSHAYIRWKSMMARCHNPRSEGFHRYGAKGIKVCERWHTFEGFLADMGEPPQKTVLDRVDYTKGYSPSNCRWASFKQSTQNRSNTVWIGASRVNEVAELYGIPAHRVYQRLRLGWGLKEIIRHPGPLKHGYDRNGSAFNPTANARNAAKRRSDLHG